MVGLLPCAGVAGWLFGGMDSKSKFDEYFYYGLIHLNNIVYFPALPFLPYDQS